MVIIIKSSHQDGQKKQAFSRLHFAVNRVSWDSHFKLCDKNTSLSTASGFRAARLHVTTFPPMQKALSEGLLDAGMHRYFFTNFPSLGKFTSCVYHQSSGFTSLSTSGITKQLLIYFSIAVCRDSTSLDSCVFLK